MGNPLSPPSLSLPREKCIKDAQILGGLPHQIPDEAADFKARGVKHGGKEGDWILCWGFCF